MKLAMVQRLYCKGYILYILLDKQGKFHTRMSDESLYNLGDNLLNYKIYRNKAYKSSDETSLRYYDERDISKRFIIKSIDLYDIRDITSELHSPRIAVAKCQGRTNRSILTELSKMWIAENKNSLIVRETLAYLQKRG